MYVWVWMYTHRVRVLAYPQGSLTLNQIGNFLYKNLPNSIPRSPEGFQILRKFRYHNSIILLVTRKASELYFYDSISFIWKITKSKDEEKRIDTKVHTDANVLTILCICPRNWIAWSTSISNTAYKESLDKVLLPMATIQ